MGNSRRENAWFSLKWGICEEKTRDFRLNEGFEKTPDFRVKWGILEEKMRDFLVKWGISEEKTHDFLVKCWILEEKTLDFRLNEGFEKSRDFR
ncbi:Uncharacterised protein [Chlamydia abortus]|nr:Uncharacterised protein [Chlamydia abortus]